VNISSYKFPNLPGSGSLTTIPAMAKPRKASDPFNRALGIFLEWGPAQATPVRERIAKALPELRPAEIKSLLSEFAALVSASCRIVEEQVEKHQTEEDGRNRVASVDARVSPANATLLYQQARYSAWRDGFG
jgi:hypothetical protein